MTSRRRNLLPDGPGPAGHGQGAGPSRLLPGGRGQRPARVPGRSHAEGRPVAAARGHRAGPLRPGNRGRHPSTPGGSSCKATASASRRRSSGREGASPFTSVTLPGIRWNWSRLGCGGCRAGGEPRRGVIAERTHPAWTTGTISPPEAVGDTPVAEPLSAAPHGGPGGQAARHTAGAGRLRPGSHGGGRGKAEVAGETDGVPAGVPASAGAVTAAAGSGGVHACTP